MRVLIFLFVFPIFAFSQDQYVYEGGDRWKFTGTKDNTCQRECRVKAEQIKISNVKTENDIDKTYEMFKNESVQIDPNQNCQYESIDKTTKQNSFDRKYFSEFVKKCNGKIVLISRESSHTRGMVNKTIKVKRKLLPFLKKKKTIRVPDTVSFDYYFKEVLSDGTIFECKGSDCNTALAEFDKCNLKFNNLFMEAKKYMTPVDVLQPYFNMFDASVHQLKGYSIDYNKAGGEIDKNDPKIFSGGKCNNNTIKELEAVVAKYKKNKRSIKKLAQCEKKFTKQLNKAVSKQVPVEMLKEFTDGVVSFRYRNTEKHQINLEKGLLFKDGKCNKKALRSLRKLIRKNKKANPNKLERKKKSCQKKIDRQFRKAERKKVSAETINSLKEQYSIEKLFDTQRAKCDIKDLKRAVKDVAKGK